MYLTDSEINEAVTEMNAGGLNANEGSEGLPPQQSAPAPQDLGYDPNLTIKYRASGKDLQEPLSAVIQRASRGYDYHNLVTQLRSREEQLSAKEKALQEIEGRWKPYDEYAQQNPEWADYVRNSWETRFNWQNQGQQSQRDPQQQYGSLPPELVKEIQELRGFAQKYREDQDRARRAEEDSLLDQHISATKQQYPDIDFSVTDPESGMSLEMRVLQHAAQNGINNFGASFRDFYHEQLINRAVMKAREDVAKGVQQNHRQGFLARSENPLVHNKQVAQTRAPSGSGYLSDLMNGAREMGIL